MAALAGEERETMTDEEVGELWHKHKLPIVNAIIRKLVEERVSKYRDRRVGLKLTLRDFHIDPKSWEKTHDCNPENQEQPEKD